MMNSLYKKFKLRLRLKTKIVLYFIVLSAVFLALLGYTALSSVEKVGYFAEKNIIDIGNNMANVNSFLTEQTGKESIRNKALNVAGQIKTYLDSHPNVVADGISKSTALEEIAVQHFGKTGYTAMYEETRFCDLDSLVIRFHINREFDDFVLSDLGKEQFLWRSLSIDREILGGYYYWKDINGNIKEKFMYLVPVGGTSYLSTNDDARYKINNGEVRYIVAATMDTDEFFATSNKINDNIYWFNSYIQQYIEQQKEQVEWFLIVAILVMIFITAGLIFAIARTITKPVLALTDGSKVMAKGDFDHRVNVNTGDEIEELARQFNIMAASLKESYSELEQKVDERTKSEHRLSEQLRAINEVGRKISSVLSINSLLPHVVNSIQDTFNYYDINIFLFDDNSDHLVLKAGAGRYTSVVPIGSQMKVNDGIIGWVANSGLPFLVNDVNQEPRYRFVEELADTKSELAVPIKIGTEILGVIDIESAETNAFDELDLFTAETLADQLAIAIHNAQLYERAQDLATLEERQRLARELHDSVTQSLFSAKIISEVLPNLWSKNPVEAQMRLNDLQQLTRSALAEMRALLMELRPAALTEVGLSDLIRHLTDVVSNRAGVPITISAEVEGKLPANVQIALYRIAQEVLSNIEKHARASEAMVTLRFQDGQMELLIRDNGCGFNPEEISPQHFGLHIMRERAEAIGATLKLQSRVGQGTQVTIIWTDTQRKG